MKRNQTEILARLLCVLTFALFGSGAMMSWAHASVLVLRTLAPGGVGHFATLSVELTDTCPAGALMHELGSNDLSLGYAHIPEVAGQTVNVLFPGVSAQRNICIDGAPDKVVVTPLEGSALAAGNLCGAAPTPRTAVKKGGGQLVLQNCLTFYRVYGTGIGCTPESMSCLGSNNSRVYAGGTVLRFPDDYVYSAFGQTYDVAVRTAYRSTIQWGGAYVKADHYFYDNVAAFGTARSGYPLPPVSTGYFERGTCYGNVTPCTFPGLANGAVSSGNFGGDFPKVVTAPGCTAAQRSAEGVPNLYWGTYTFPANSCVMSLYGLSGTEGHMVAPGYSYILGY